MKKFTSRSVAVRRIFAELQKLTASAEVPGEPATDPTVVAPVPAAAGSAKNVKAMKSASGPRATSKTAHLIGMLRSPKGATL